MTTFQAKNLNGDIAYLKYDNIDQIQYLLTEKFGYHPLHEPIWLDEDGDEKVPPRNGETVFVLYRYRNIPVNFIVDWICVDNDDNDENISFIEYTLLIEKKDMDNLYDEIAISFYKHQSKKIFYSEKENFCVIEEDRSSRTKYINLPDESVNYFTSIEDLFLSFKEDRQDIPESFFEHLSICVKNKWN